MGASSRAPWVSSFVKSYCMRNADANQSIAFQCFPCMSVSHFAPPEQACEIYESLPKLLDSPPEDFVTQLAALSVAAECDG